MTTYRVTIEYRTTTTYVIETDTRTRAEAARLAFQAEEGNYQCPVEDAGSDVDVTFMSEDGVPLTEAEIDDAVRAAVDADYAVQTSPA
jgi:hypothetical protein